MSLESFLIKQFGLPEAPKTDEVDNFCHKILAESNLTDAKVETIAKSSFSGYQKRRISLNESQADTIYDLLVLVRKKMGK